MLNISLEKMPRSIFDIEPMSIKRDWMDATSEKHAYRCFPVTQANVIGWSIFCTEDVSFVWDGISDQTGDHVKIISPSQEHAYTGRGQSSISFSTGLIFKTDKDVSMFTINPVNYYSEEFETMSSLITTSFYDNPIPLAIKAKLPNKEITIRSGTPLATIIPISLTSMNNTTIEIFNYEDMDLSRQANNSSYGAAAQKINSSGGWTDWYRDAVNENGESLGQHETKVLRLQVKDNRKMV
jgi:hypothetical protein